MHNCLAERSITITVKPILLLLQFVQWLDALMMVFNVNDELSGSVLPGFYARMAQYRDFSDIPLLLVGIKGILLFENY